MFAGLTGASVVKRNSNVLAARLLGTGKSFFPTLIFTLYITILNRSRPECQHASWATHKKECKINRMIYDMEQKKEKEAAQRPIQKPRTTHCTGCNVKYSEDYESDQICPDCGYTTCESCSCHNSRGESTIFIYFYYRLLTSPTGSCYCLNSNFGHSYCERGTFYHYFE